jgi:hypothetical protein
MVMASKQCALAKCKTAWEYQVETSAGITGLCERHYQNYTQMFAKPEKTASHKAVEQVLPDQPISNTLTTDQMDKTTPDDRYRLVVRCSDCREWHHFVGNRDRFSQTTGEQCKCGSNRFDSRSLISERTWHPAIK